MAKEKEKETNEVEVQPTAEETEEKQEASEKKEAKVNTTKSVREAQKTTTATLDGEIKKAQKVLKEQKKVAVKIPAYLEKRVGKNVPVVVNGAVIHVPVGEKVKIPESMAEILNESLADLKL